MLVIHWVPKEDLEKVINRSQKKTALKKLSPSKKLRGIDA